MPVFSKRPRARDDLIEAVVLLPENLFYNTPAAGIVVVLNRHKDNGRKRQFLLINASAFFAKRKPKNEKPVVSRRRKKSKPKHRLYQSFQQSKLQRSAAKLLLPRLRNPRPN